jgi:O-antigen/teichoic acid export membrane protein
MAGYGPAFADGSRTLVLTVVTAGLLAVLSPAAQVIAAAGRMWIGLWMNCGWAAVLIVSSRLLIGHGAEGLAGGRLLAYVAHSVWTIAFVAHLARRSRGAVATVPDPTDGRCTNGRGR